MNARRDEFVAEVTAGLKGDPELRRDVSAEIGSHLDDAIEEARTRGRSDDEALTDAVQSFGSPVSLAADLADANRPRMRLRSLIRLALMTVFMPVALLLAGFVVWNQVLRLARLEQTVTAFDNTTISGVIVEKLNRPLSRCREKQIHQSWGVTPDQRLIIFGDVTRASPAGQQKAIWEAHPTNRIFYANYIRYLLGEETNSAVLISALRQGQQLDPENGFYGCMLAGVMARQAAEVSPDLSGLTIRDRPLLDAAWNEYLSAVAKPAYHRYVGEMLATRRSLLPKSGGLDEELTRYELSAGFVFPEGGVLRSLARASIVRGGMLLAEGDRTMAVALLCAWSSLEEKMVADSSTYVDILVAHAINDLGLRRAIPSLDKAGFKDEAAMLRLKSEAMATPIAKYSNILRHNNNATIAMVQNKGSILANTLLPAIGAQEVAEDELAPGRYVEQVVMEQAAVMMLILFFLVLMLFAGLLALRSRRAKGSESAPFLILPDWRQATFIIGVSVVLPVTLYILYTRFSGLAGREMSLTWNWRRFIAELAVLGIFMLVCSVWLSLQHVRRRCRALGVPVPATRRKGIAAWFAVWRSDYGLYLGTAARSLIPTFAVAILLLGGVVQPWLAHEETRWLRADPLISQGNNIGGFTAVETRLVNRLKKEILEAARKGEP